MEINRTTAHLYREAVNIVAASDGRFVCAVIDKDDWNPFNARRETWKTHAQVTIQLLNAVMGNGHPILSVVVDHLTTPASVNYEGYLTTSVNRTQGYLAVAGANRMDSRACMGLQLADIFTGAVGHQYRQGHDPTARAASPKGQVAEHVAQAWNLPTLVGAAPPASRSSTSDHPNDGSQRHQPERPKVPDDSGRRGDGLKQVGYHAEVGVSPRLPTHRGVSHRLPTSTKTGQRSSRRGLRAPSLFPGPRMSVLYGC